MTPISKTALAEIFNQTPSLSTPKLASKWILETRRMLEDLVYDPYFKYEYACIEWRDIDEPRDKLLGLYPSENWQKFVIGTYLADISSYSQSEDQVSFDRLIYLMHAFPEGFRLWWLKHNHTWLPVGYTGWYPVTDLFKEAFNNRPEYLRNRMVVPDTSGQGNPFLYLFNFSVIHQLRKTNLSRNLMVKFITEILSQKASGLACITVSDDGKRVAQRLGMEIKGTVGTEKIFVRNF